VYFSGDIVKPLGEGTGVKAVKGEGMPTRKNPFIKGNLFISKNYTRNEWGRCETTLETSGDDVKLHSKRVEKM
jgi:hypothetical protein